MGKTKNLEIVGYEKRNLAMREERRLEKKHLERLKLRLAGKMQGKSKEQNAGNAA